jgi:hypothetical protein
MKVLFAKTGWSDYFQGGAVLGRHSHIMQTGDAHEKYNFFPGPDDRFYAYIPGFPKHPDRSDWMIIFVAAENGKGKLKVVGWYENAILEEDWAERPEYELGLGFEKDYKGNPYFYCVSAKKAVLIPPEERNIIVSGQHFARSPFVYILDENSSSGWRKEFLDIAKKLLSPKNGKKSWLLSKKVNTERNKKIEQIAIKTAFSHFQQLGYKIIDRQRDNCGYDFIAKKGESELHVEVKGCSSSQKRFFLSRNENEYSGEPRWRLFLVSNCLKIPKINIFKRVELMKIFTPRPTEWEFVEKNG